MHICYSLWSKADRFLKKKTGQHSRGTQVIKNAGQKIS